MAEFLYSKNLPWAGSLSPGCLPLPRELNPPRSWGPRSGKMSGNQIVKRSGLVEISVSRPHSMGGCCTQHRSRVPITTHCRSTLVSGQLVDLYRTGASEQPSVQTGRLGVPSGISTPSVNPEKEVVNPYLHPLRCTAYYGTPHT